MNIEQKLLCVLLADDALESPFYAEVRGALALVDWESFWELVRRHRVTALIAVGASRVQDLTLPDPVRSASEEAAGANSQTYLQTVNLAAQLVRALSKQGIACAVLKGITVAERYYQQPAQREMIDLDVLVDPARYEEAEQLVLSLGFTRLYPRFALTDEVRGSFKALHNAFTFVRLEDRMQIDLHWRTVKNPALLSRLNEEWQGMISETPAANVVLPTLAPAPHALYIIVHGAKHAWVRLKWLVDMDRVLRGLSAEEVAALIDLSKQNRMERVVASSAALSRRLLGTPFGGSNGGSVGGEFEQFVAQYVDEGLVAQQIAMIWGPLPGKSYSLKDTGQLLRRMRHSFSLHRGGGYRRAALLREVARPEDLETIELTADRLWLLPLISPLLALGRKLGSK